MDRRQWLHAASVLTASGALAGCNGRAGPLKIGVVQPLSGGSMKEGTDMLHGVRLAVDELNARGGVRLPGGAVPLAITAQDDRSDAEAGVAAAHALVAAGVTVAIGHLSSGVSIAAAPIYAAAGIPQFAISTKAQYTRLGLPTTLRLVANDDLQARALGHYAAQWPGAQRYAVLDDSSVYAKSLAGDVATLLSALGRAVPVRLTLDRTVVAFADLVQRLKAAQVDVVVPILNDFQVVALARQLADAGLQHARIIGADGIKTQRLAQMDMRLRAICATSPILEPREFVNGPAFLKRFQARFGEPPFYAAHYAYDAVHLVADALARNGSADKAELLQRLKTFDGHAPVTGSMRFRSDGEQRYGTVAVYQLRQGAWEPLMRSDQW